MRTSNLRPILRYFAELRSLCLGPRSFFDSVFSQGVSRTELGVEAVRFVRSTGVLFALLFFMQELLLGGRLSWIVLLVAVVGLLAFPFLAEAASVLAGWSLVLSASLLGESPDPVVVRRVAAYALAGLLPLATGLTLVPWLSLATVVFLAAGLERGLKCSPFKAALLAGFPAALVLSILLLAAFIFKIQVF